MIYIEPSPHRSNQSSSQQLRRAVLHVGLHFLSSYLSSYIESNIISYMHQPISINIIAQFHMALQSVPLMQCRHSCGSSHSHVCNHASIESGLESRVHFPRFVAWRWWPTPRNVLFCSVLEFEDNYGDNFCSECPSYSTRIMLASKFQRQLLPTSFGYTHDAAKYPIVPWYPHPFQ